MRLTIITDKITHPLAKLEDAAVCQFRVHFPFQAKQDVSFFAPVVSLVTG
jgi:hypothetical protein